MATLLGGLPPGHLRNELVVTARPFLEQHCVRCQDEKMQKESFPLSPARGEVSATGLT